MNSIYANFLPVLKSILWKNWKHFLFSITSNISINVPRRLKESVRSSSLAVFRKCLTSLIASFAWREEHLTVGSCTLCKIHSGFEWPRCTSQRNVTLFPLSSCSSRPWDMKMHSQSIWFGVGSFYTTVAPKVRSSFVPRGFFFNVKQSNKKPLACKLLSSKKKNWFS